MFRRRKGDDHLEQDGVADETDELDDDADVQDEDDEDGVAREPGRPEGPWDVEDAPEAEGAVLDLGSIRVPGHPEVEVQVNLDEASGLVVAVTAVHGQSALQLQAFAAARNEALWPQVRKELAAGITKDGGLADVDGDALRAKLPFPQPDGSVALADVRFFGTDGPRWMLRGVLSGDGAADPAAAQTLMSVYRGVVVVRGTEAFAPSEPLPLRLPEQPGEPGPQPPDRTRLDPTGTGQRIAEIR